MNTRQLVLLVHTYGPGSLTVEQVNGTVKSLIKIIEYPERWHLEDLQVAKAPTKKAVKK